MSGAAIKKALQEYQSESLRQLADEEGFALLADLLKSLAGIHLPDNDKNRTLMASRLGMVLRSHGFQTYAEYHRYLTAGANGGAAQEFVSALTTNTTEFFRENKHFPVFAKALGELRERRMAEGTREVRIWCGAASTGQEPYSILMTALEAYPDLMSWNLKFLATDIDLEVLSQAASGHYSEQEAKGVPPLYRQKFFRASPGSLCVREEYRTMIRFAQLNLLSNPYPFQHKFDFIFCRNVLIYFDKATTASVLQKMGRALSPGGVLFIGHSESGAMKLPDFAPIAHAAYQKKSKGGEK